MKVSNTNGWLIGFAGFSGGSCKTIADALNEVRRKFSFTSFTVEAKAGRSPYTSQYIAKFIERTWTEVFYKGSKHGGSVHFTRYCDHYERACCDKSIRDDDGDCKRGKFELCGRLKPKCVLVVYSAESGDDLLLESCNKFSFTIGVTREELLSQPNRAGIKLGELIERAHAALEWNAYKLSVAPTRQRSAMSLPVRNFVCRGNLVSRLLKEASSLGGNPEQFHNDALNMLRYRDRGARFGFRDRRSLDFTPSDTASHGRTAVPEVLAGNCLFWLSSFFRTGVALHEYLHFDVDRKEYNSPIDREFYCVKLGGNTRKVTGTHVNIYPNDVVGNIA